VLEARIHLFLGLRQGEPGLNAVEFGPGGALVAG
jgi:hypothetical protein